MKAANLSSFELFKNVPESLIDSILPSCSLQVISAGNYLVRKGVDNHQLYLLLEGNVAIYLDESDLPLKIVSAGSTIGEISLMDRKSATASVITLTECQVIVLDEKQVWALFCDSCTFARNYLQLLTSRLRIVNSQVVSSIEKQRVFEHKSNIDNLTQLYNRGWLNENFDYILEHCVNKSQAFSYCMIDIDHFKRINDSYGHQAGDLSLQVIADILKKLSRASDYVARYGGEEIVILLPNVNANHALIFAERIRKTIADTPVDYLIDKPINLTVSIGVTTHTDNQTSTDLIRLADRAMYRAKAQGRNRVIFDDGSLVF
jgi:diguanylate cyclase (GGDEF)-like protein